MSSLETIWNHWKEEILLALTGVLLFSGIMGFLIGVCSSCYRKDKTTKRHKTKTSSVSLTSELYAEIDEASNEILKGPEQSSASQTTLNADIDHRPPCDCNQRSNSEHDYSHVYNTLQPNYGSNRLSHPGLSSQTTLEITYPYRQCRSLQNLSDQNLIQWRASKISV
ncbi:uncharacterized protein LOC130047811 [Ostrea edulis]|uniref:uncharacterized protein LOC130047811 n=1 Tax=Ostrea edulis TaxID=37623 RepID=UPI0024AF1088|nr:uncharacterized protein LOC130047811 [Ostrea edulis]